MGVNVVTPQTTKSTIRASSIQHHRSPVTRITKRKINPNTVLQLYVAAGGRCEFRGCNRPLTRHHLTHRNGNFGEVAHIVAFSKRGPRGNSAQRPVDIHDPNNLMLLCPHCHKEIDTHADKYPVEILQGYKVDHEQRIGFATGVTQEHQTVIVQLVARINNQVTKIPTAQIHAAVSPKYPLERPNCLIDLNSLSMDDDEAISVTTRIIDSSIRDLFSSNLYTEPVQHISVFALAPIPAMVYLGYRLGNTVPAELYRHHRDTDDWKWQMNPKALQFTYDCIQEGTDKTAVALLLSISGKVLLSSLPSTITGDFFIYEIAPVSVIPSTNCLKTTQELENFKRTYEEFRRMLFREHHDLKTIHLFPAVPSPVAVLCGRELMPKVDPSLAVYDYNKRSSGFNFVLEVNQL